MIEVASCVGTVKYIRRGISAISYEIALDTNSVTADGKTGKFLTTKLGKYHFLKHTGNKTEDCTDVLETFNFLVLPIDKNGAVLINGRISGGASGYIYDPFFDESIKEEDVSQIKFFWYSAPVAEAGNFNYIKALTNSQGVPTKNMPFTILASNTFLVVRQGADGPQGPPGAAGSRGSSGPVWRQHVGFVSATADAPYQYYTGSNDERFIDVVLIGKVWYRCLQSYKSTGTADARNTPTNAEFAKYWTSADMANFTFIATHFLLAENAKINLFGSNEINLYGSDAEGKIFASFRVPNGNGDDSQYALWLGAETGAAAPFSVTKAGHAKAADVDISGKITAISGAIGNFVIADGSIKFVSSTKTCEICTNYVQYVDASKKQSLYFGYGDSGVKAQLTAKDSDDKDMSCAMVSGEDDVGKNKIVAFTTAMTGYTSKLTPYELMVGDYYHNYVQIRVANDVSNFGTHRISLPTIGIKCIVDKKASTLYLALAGIPSGRPSTKINGMIYEENGYLKIYKG
jgi:hypothetical protein